MGLTHLTSGGKELEQVDRAVDRVDCLVFFDELNSTFEILEERAKELFSVVISEVSGDLTTKV